jgi:hypothetical protein
MLKDEPPTLRAILTIAMKLCPRLRSIYAAAPSLFYPPSGSSWREEGLLAIALSG